MGCSQAEHQPCSWRVLKSTAPFPRLIHSLVVPPLLQQALQALQEEQARLKIRLQELQLLQRNLRDCPQDKVNFEGVWPGRESWGSLNFTPGPATSLLCDLIHLLTYSTSSSSSCFRINPWHSASVTYNQGCFPPTRGWGDSPQP